MRVGGGRSRTEAGEGPGLGAGGDEPLEAGFGLALMLIYPLPFFTGMPPPGTEVGAGLDAGDTGGVGC